MVPAAGEGGLHAARFCWPLMTRIRFTVRGAQVRPLLQCHPLCDTRQLRDRYLRESPRPAEAAVDRVRGLLNATRPGLRARSDSTSAALRWLREPGQRRLPLAEARVSRLTISARRRSVVGTPCSMRPGRGDVRAAAGRQADPYGPDHEGLRGPRSCPIECNGAGTSTLASTPMRKAGFHGA